LNVDDGRCWWCCVFLEGRSRGLIRLTPSIGFARVVWHIQAAGLSSADLAGDVSGSGAKKKRIRVCAVALNPRQGSLFRTNRIGFAGSGKYVYFTKAKCPWDVRLLPCIHIYILFSDPSNGLHLSFNPLKPRQVPRVRLISYVKCCNTIAKVTASIKDAMQTHDVVVVTGDEYCGVTDVRPHFRQYYGTSVISKSGRVAKVPGWQGQREMMDGNGTMFPLYIPLGLSALFFSSLLLPPPTNASA